jgi:ribosomal protein S18 acetylase RimI-like enzyme
MHAAITAITNAQIDEYKDQILDTYRQAFSEPPYNKTEADVISFSQTLDLHRNRVGARFLVAQDNHQEVLGFAYGYETMEGQWWYDVVSKSLPFAAIKEWLQGAYELVELAVRPSSQGQGIGGRLHDAILTGLPNRTAVLSTIATETVALHLYRKRGWVTLIEDFTFPTSIHTYLIMGLKLPQNLNSNSSNR